MTLNIMVLESERGAADEATHELKGSGHVVLRCHDTARPAFPCRGILDPSTCPLRSHAVDVVLTVRPGISPRPSATEDGVQCALMHRVPLVVAGPRALDPYEGLATEVLGRNYSVVGACEAAAAAELPEHTRCAATVIAGTLRDGGSGVPTVSVVRRNGGLLVKVTGLEARSARERQAAVVRVVGALRALDRNARSIDVLLDDAEVTE